MLELNQDNLKEILEDNKKVVVQFGAAWCGNCRMIKPKFKQLAEKQEEITFVYVDAEKFPGARELASIENLPTFASYKNGNLVSQVQGNKISIVEELANEIANN